MIQNINHAPLLSIIIPVYNAESYLKTCLDSIIKQDNKDWEAILINDGSTDESLRICEEYAKRDSRFIVLSQDNSGPSIARNRGLERARGEWISFIDSDDAIEDNYIGIIPSAKEVDLIFFGYKELRGENIIEHRITQEPFYSTNHDSTLSKLYSSKELFFGFTVNKFFKRHIIEQNNIRFSPELDIKEDEIFTLNYIEHVQTIFISNSAPYIYRILSTSLSHSNRKINFLPLSQRMTERIEHLPYPSLKTRVASAAVLFYCNSIIYDQPHHNVRNTINFVEQFIKKYDIKYPNVSIFKIINKLPSSVLRSIAMISYRNYMKLRNQ